jgi:hypothetical protein
VFSQARATTKKGEKNGWVSTRAQKHTLRKKFLSLDAQAEKKNRQTKIFVCERGMRSIFKVVPKSKLTQRGLCYKMCEWVSGVPHAYLRNSLAQPTGYNFEIGALPELAIAAENDHVKAVKAKAKAKAKAKRKQ